MELSRKVHRLSNDGTQLGQSHSLPKANRASRVKEPTTKPLVDRDSARRRARRLEVELDVGELCCGGKTVRNREAVLALIKPLAQCALWLAWEVQMGLTSFDYSVNLDYKSNPVTR